MSKRMHPVVFLNHFCTYSSASFFKLYLNCQLWNFTLWCFFKWKVAVGEVTFQSISRHPLLQCEWMIWKKECWKLCKGPEQEGLEWGDTWEHPTLIKRHSTKEKIKTEKGKQEVPMTQSSPFTDLFLGTSVQTPSQWNWVKGNWTEWKELKSVKTIKESYLCLLKWKGPW